MGAGPETVGSETVESQGALDPGSRLAAQETRLRLLLQHLAGPAIRARVELDDLVQEVFLRALAAADGWPPASAGDAALQRYLARIARHCTIDVARAIRARKRAGCAAPLVPSDWSAPGLRESRVAGGASGPATRAAASEEVERLGRAWIALSAEHRRVIGLRQFEGLDAREAGRRMGRSEAAVHSLYRRALLAWDERFAH